MDQKKWLRLSLFNLLIVSVLGVVLRYKIAFSLAFLDQKKLLHGHSHFAFSGWITQALMAIIVARLMSSSDSVSFRRYNPVLWANAICAYGMLFSFPIQGYGLFSIFFSTAALIVAYIFMVMVWKDTKAATADNVHFPWVRAAVVFNSISSIGAFALAYMMATRNMHQHWYLGSVYFFLHFQYNGWFSFTILGLLARKLAQCGVPRASLRKVFLMMVVSCGPAYFLSALWMEIPMIVYIAVVVSSILQAVGWGMLLHLFRQNHARLKEALGHIPFTISTLSVLAFTIKFALQLGSTIPALSTLAFGFRPIVIGYLHLVLLGAISLFIIGYILHIEAVTITPVCKMGLVVFISGIILNELVLMIQGITAMQYIAVPYVNEALFAISLIMFTGLVLINLRPGSSESPREVPSPAFSKS
jgi:hypothetical protein